MSRRRRPGPPTGLAATGQQHPEAPPAPEPTATRGTATRANPTQAAGGDATAVDDTELTGLDVLLQRARLAVSPADRPSKDARTALTLRSAGIPLLAAAVVGSSATGAAAVPSPAGSAPKPATPRSASQTPAPSAAAARGAVPQSGSHATSVLVAAAARKKSPPVVTYVVRSGDTLSEIAHRARIRLAALTRANHLRATDIIRPGQRLVLPGVRPAPAQRRTPATRRPRPVVHVVRAGDTVSAIALRHRITVAAIIKANRLRADALIHPGRKLVLPGVRRRPATRTSSPATHVRRVKAGDTLSAIALQEKVALRELLALNHLHLRSIIRPGQRLLVPGPPAVPNSFAGRTYPDAVARAAAANRAVLAGRAVPSRATMRRTVSATARRYGVPPSLALAVAYQESGFNQRAVSPANAIGTMQVIPSSGVWASRLVGRRLDLLDPKDNVTAGVAILAALRKAADDERSAIAGYYQGLSSVNRHGMFPDTRRYVANVQRLQTRFA
ncbi:MAG: LysM peptidoglycan-binding domain-containing protein [Kineosporiaceae bacterium]